MTDQAESGASTVDEPEVDARTAWGFARHGDEMDAANWAYVYADRLCADIERVTAEIAIRTQHHADYHGICSMGGNTPCPHEAERDNWRSGYQEKDREWTQEVLRAAKAEAERDAALEVVDAVRTWEYPALFAALARFEATRKAAADAEQRTGSVWDHPLLRSGPPNLEEAAADAEEGK